MITVTLYWQKGCELCEQVKEDLSELQQAYPHRLALVDIDNDPTLKTNYEGRLPVVQVGPYRLHSPISQQQLKVALGAAADRSRQMEAVGDETYQKRVERGRNFSSADRFTTWFSTHYMVLINLLLFAYLGFPFLAPVLAKAGAKLPARIIYTIYSPLCHQLSFRSWFLFGEQPAYPLARADVPGLLPYEQAIGQGKVDILQARQFTGNEAIGYKVAICERDVAQYAALLLFGLVFAATGRQIKAIPWYVWVIVGILPIGIDGVSQLPSMLNLPGHWLIRESTPLLRTVTGGLFGLMTAWFLFPMIEDSMRDTRAMMTTKIAVVSQVHSDSSNDISRK